MIEYTKPHPWNLGRGPKPREQRVNLLGEPTLHALLDYEDHFATVKDACACGYQNGHAPACPTRAPAEPPKPAGEDVPTGWTDDGAFAGSGSRHFTHDSGAAVFRWAADQRWCWRTLTGPNSEPEFDTAQAAMGHVERHIARAPEPAAQPSGEVPREGWEARGEYMGKPDYYGYGNNVFWGMDSKAWLVQHSDGSNRYDTPEAAMQRAEELARKGGGR